MIGGGTGWLAEDVSRETRERLETYETLLKKWNSRINLVGRSTIAETWQRHFADSAQLLTLAEPEAGLWVDLGTGGGFPGLVVAILASEVRPDLRVTCIESDQRKAAFLRTVIAATGTNARVIAKRIEDIPPMGADVVSARALAPLPLLLAYAEQHLRPEGNALFLKGASYAQEVRESLETWTFRLDTYPSKTENEAVILKIGEIRRV